MGFFKVCSIQMKLKKFDQKTVELVPDLMDMESETELTQYSIKEWSLAHKDNGIVHYTILHSSILLFNTLENQFEISIINGQFI